MYWLLSYCLSPSNSPFGTLFCDKYIDKKDVHHTLSGRKKIKMLIAISFVKQIRKYNCMFVSVCIMLCNNYLFLGRKIPKGSEEQLLE